MIKKNLETNLFILSYKKFCLSKKKNCRKLVRLVLSKIAFYKPRILPIVLDAWFLFYLLAL